MDLEMQVTTDAVPVQVEGTVNGRPFYFRARHEGWTFTIADTLDDAVDAAWNSATVFFRAGTYGTERFAASYMPIADAERIIRACAEEYARAEEP